MIIVPDKKTQGRYTLQFNLADPEQKSVSDILEQQGRHKTQFITNAVLCYVNGGGKSKVDTTEALDDMMIVLTSFTGAERGVIPVTLIVVTVLYLGREIVNGVTDKSNVSQLAHIVGGVCGLVLGYLLHVR